MRPSGGDQPLGLHAGGETLPNKWPFTEGPGNRAAAKPDLRRISFKETRVVFGGF